MRVWTASGAAAIFLAAAGPALCAVGMPGSQATTAADKAARTDIATSDSDGFTLSTGVDYSAGRYGATTSTDILVGLFTGSYKTGNWQFTAAIPYLNITGPAYVVVGAGGVPVLISPPKGSASTVRGGFGDLNLSGTYTLDADTLEWLDEYEVDLTARTKIATADTAKGLSSGETDFGFSADITRQIGIWGPFVTFGYRIPGSPGTYSLNSAPSFSLGTSVQMADNFLAIFSYDFDGTISNSLPDSQMLFASGSYILNDHLTFTVYAELGMSSGSPAQGTGLLVSWKIP